MNTYYIECKSILNKSRLADYCLNCYTGCEHGCRYCYANFMRRYTEHRERWGEFVDVKVNAVEALTKEVKKKKRGEVFLSSVCDGWQPVEAKYKLTRKCVKILLENGFSLTILTKSVLVERDFDLLKANPKNVELGLTLTTLNERLQSLIEPRASSPGRRLATLKKAADSGIRVYAFLGPLLPYLCDRELDIDKLFHSLRDIGLEYIYVDRLNPRYGVWTSLYPFLRRHYSSLCSKYKILLSDDDSLHDYSQSLAKRVKRVAKKHGLEKRLKFCF